MALLDAGKLVALGSPAQVREAAATRCGNSLIVETERYREAVQALRKTGLAATLFGRDIHVLMRDPDETTARIEAVLGEAGLSARVRQGSSSLEDAFIERIESARAEGEAA